MVFLRSISVPCPYHPRTCTLQKLIVLLRTLNCIHMGKGLGLIGNFRGRVGNVIGYELKNSRDKVTQGLRQWQPYVKNPQTLPQIRQRAKLQNINNVYRALEPIISRGFENVEYGDKSRNYFMKLALTSESVPFTEKDSKIAVPADYIISEGSLPAIKIQDLKYNETAKTDTLRTTLLFYGNWDQIKTIGKFSENIINNNSLIENGDELTFIEISKQKNYFIYAARSIIIDIENDTTFDSIHPNRNRLIYINGIIFTRYASRDLAFNMEATPASASKIGGAVIISRPYGEKHRLRSTNRIWFDESYVSEYYSEAAMQRAYLSYMKKTWNRDWPEEQIIPNNL